MKSFLKSKLIILVKYKKNKKYKVKFRFYKLQKDKVTELTTKIALSLEHDLTKQGYIEMKNEFKEDIDFANAAFWILKNFVNTTGSDTEILKWPRYYMEV